MRGRSPVKRARGTASGNRCPMMVMRAIVLGTHSLMKVARGTVLGNRSRMKVARGTMLGSRSRMKAGRGTVLGSRSRMKVARRTVLGSRSPMKAARGTVLENRSRVKMTRGLVQIREGLSLVPDATARPVTRSEIFCRRRSDKIAKLALANWRGAMRRGRHGMCGMHACITRQRTSRGRARDVHLHVCASMCRRGGLVC
jgi:hypothetical protein